MYAVSIQYNDRGPFTAVSAKRAGLNVVLGTDREPGSGYLHLGVFVQTAGRLEDYFLETVKPGDRIRITYHAAGEETPVSIEGLANEATTGAIYQVPPGLRLGLDGHDSGGRKVRLSHPPDGDFGFAMTNASLDHARALVTAENGSERWRWQFRDLYLGDSVEFEVAETDWHTPFPHVERT